MTILCQARRSPSRLFSTLQNCRKSKSLLIELSQNKFGSDELDNCLIFLSYIFGFENGRTEIHKFRCKLLEFKNLVCICRPIITPALKHQSKSSASKFSLLFSSPSKFCSMRQTVSNLLNSYVRYGIKCLMITHL